MVFVQKWPFFHLLVLGNKSQENVFYDILERKNTFLGYKKKKGGSSSRKIDIFPKRLVNPLFWSKNGHFPSFFFRQYSIGKCPLRYSRTKKCLSRLQKKRFKKLKNGHFSKGVNPWFWSKNHHFSSFFFKAI